MAELKSAALPLGYAPNAPGKYLRAQPRADAGGRTITTRTRADQRFTSDLPHGKPHRQRRSHYIMMSYDGADPPVRPRGRAERSRRAAAEETMTYHAPLADMSFALKYGAGLVPALEEGFFGDLTIDDVEAVLAEAGRMAAEVIGPLDRVGDRVGATFKDGAVTTAPGWRRLTTLGAKAAGTVLPRRRNGAAKGCRKRSMPFAPKCGTARPWRSVSVPC